MLRLTLAVATAALLLSPLGAAAQGAPPPYGPPITLETAKKAVAAAEAEARKNNWKMVIVVVDSGGRLVALERMDDAFIGAIDIAVGKATTANNLKRPTKALEDGVAHGGAGLRTLAVPGVMPVEGGVPIVIGGKIAGAIGVSGASSQQDAQCANAGAAAAK